MNLVLNLGMDEKACCIGCVTQAINVSLAPLLFIIFQNEFGFSFEQIGRIILINFGTQIVADIIAAKYVDKIGCRPEVLTALVLSVTRLAGLTFLPQLMGGAYTGMIIPVCMFAALTALKKQSRSEYLYSFCS